MASISACVSCGLSTGSASESTPPEAMNLITVAPYLICQRTAARHSSGPLQTPFSTPAVGTREGGNGVWSAWPPREPMALTAKIIRGPGTAPLSMASCRPRSRKSPEPRSRIEVKPASSVRRAYSAAYCACSVGQRRIESIVSRYQLLVAWKVTCVCASIRPGSSVESPRSITCAPAGASPPTCAILSPSVTTRPGWTTVPLRASNIRAALRAIGCDNKTMASRIMHAAYHRTGSLRIAQAMVMLRR